MGSMGTVWWVTGEVRQFSVVGCTDVNSYCNVYVCVCLRIRNRCMYIHGYVGI